MVLAGPSGGNALMKFLILFILAFVRPPFCPPLLLTAALLVTEIMIARLIENVVS
jgi:hypothetical protein